MKNYADTTGKVMSDEELTAGQASHKAETTIHCYPNPVQATLNLKGLPIGETSTIQILNTNGREVFTKTGVNGKNAQMDLGHLNAGFYVVKIRTGSKVMRKKVLKE